MNHWVISFLGEPFGPSRRPSDLPDLGCWRWPPGPGCSRREAESIPQHLHRHANGYRVSPIFPKLQISPKTALVSPLFRHVSGVFCQAFQSRIRKEIKVGIRCNPWYTGWKDIPDRNQQFLRLFGVWMNYVNAFLSSVSFLKIKSQYFLYHLLHCLRRLGQSADRTFTTVSAALDTLAQESLVRSLSVTSCYSLYK